jgi:hypothetical protein
MCGRRPNIPAPVRAQVASADNLTAIREADMQARLRRRRAGAAANVLTGSLGIPAGNGTTTTVGGSAQ